MNSSSCVTLRLLVQPARPPRHLAGVRKITRRQRPHAAEPVEDVPAARIVGPHPVALGSAASRATARARATRPSPRGRAPGLRSAGSSPGVRAAPGPPARCPVPLANTTTQAAPGHQIGTRRDGRGRVDLEQGQVAHHVEQRGRPRTVQQLRAHRDAARIDTRKLVDRHHPRLSDRSRPAAVPDPRRACPPQTGHGEPSGVPGGDGVCCVDPLRILGGLHGYATRR